ncbi:MAG: tRNA (adenosine(37)-N6)-dimethylallyltransferase MiaA [Candidatus Falkowbacteria bacterium]
MSNQKKPKIIAIIGPTSSGKTGWAVSLARQFNGEIVSADSRQVYHGMDVGTGKDLVDYEASDAGPAVPYHLIDVADPSEQFGLADYQCQAYAAIDDILKRGKLPIVAGGSGLYLQAVIDGFALPEIKPDEELRQDLEELPLEELQARLKELNPAFFAKINNSDINNKRRLIRYVELNSQGVLKEPDQNKSEPRYDCLTIGIEVDKEELDKRIISRLKQRLEEQNLAGEVEGLNNSGISWQRLEKFGLEYRWLSRYLQGKIPYEEMEQALGRDIIRFAKRQLTWFKRWEKQGRQIHWINNLNEAKILIEKYLKIPLQ